MTRANNKKRRMLARSNVLHVKTVTTVKGPESTCSRPRKSSDFDTDLANLKSRMSGKKCKKNIVDKITKK